MNNKIEDLLQVALTANRELAFIADQAVSWQNVSDDLSKQNFVLQVQLDNAQAQLKHIENRITEATLYLAMTTDNVDVVKDKMTTFCIRCMGAKQEEAK